ncbi:hypothetical protein [Roseivirga pacifica]|uniref:hypothetical protein n=1 Tax=Roseivirga pacifica TaxID=1267423 RepID=UPI002094A7BB|nr:hypothetical protein [Roseivirga pacifica]MCO6360313.1 hypothetical protein [Roseivirga pacifica]MCO6367684.1 hypothetical protein [Roseivirga pacifica]MCO6369784.1 hypothetical protein [Roseivirga pacifica]MCO6375341.1 hypothetical protein [Roseivirga pacifica]MCO6380599.1 hypothetical protein [Roseivirga pacifica]
MKQFDNVSAIAFDCLKQKLKSQGIELKGDAGYLSKNGISLDYKHDSAAQSLTISNLEVGFPASLAGMNADKVMGILEKTIEECRG